MAEDNKPSRKERRQQEVDDIVGFLGSGRGMWFLVCLGVLGVIAAVSYALNAFGL
ncbi:hypothetical protein [Microbacterium sp.]|uniref:hypothetical protein n=1 Tax=Microbacterium sp. TaxID=51671 RepID=UPI003F9C73D2